LMHRSGGSIIGYERMMNAGKKERGNSMARAIPWKRILLN